MCRGSSTLSLAQRVLLMKDHVVFVKAEICIGRGQRLFIILAIFLAWHIRDTDTGLACKTLLTQLFSLTLRSSFYLKDFILKGFFLNKKDPTW